MQNLPMGKGGAAWSAELARVRTALAGGEIGQAVELLEGLTGRWTRRDPTAGELSASEREEVRCLLETVEEIRARGEILYRETLDELATVRARRRFHEATRTAEEEAGWLNDRV